ncbi:MAG: DUF2971 domain-containing protein [Flavobacterium sp.]|uniref:DUF2971 domain-containing protein n=1 Tax=Flavobacterium sp. TaxID=239 RepID=UPI00260FAB58|nr:DUF2971 domain-containing protein [Flavobacterium sp.]MDD5150934.1 DUF2971 domain-containing protein [Flavobacterium sp.]
MIIPRVFKPKRNELLYHYCDSNAFHAICTNKTIRLCDLFTMNDYLEMHWGYSIWEKAATELLSELGEEFLDAIDEVIHFSGMKGLLLASSFSLDGDVLSQWRAYADDGNGCVIGFSAQDLLKLSIRSLKVEYIEKKQILEVKKIVKAIYDVEQSQSKVEKFGQDFMEICTMLAFDLASYKNPAFSEEKEVRIVHLINFEKSNKSLKFVDYGGTAFGEESKGQEIKFLMSGNAPKTYIDLDFSNNGKVFPIKEVIIGPKNLTMPSAISVYLETLNIGNVNIKKSKASYR